MYQVGQKAPAGKQETQEKRYTLGAWNQNLFVLVVLHAFGDAFGVVNLASSTAHRLFNRVSKGA